jgi:hypothetical protein
MGTVELWRRFGHITVVQRMFIEPSAPPKERQNGFCENDVAKLKFQRDGAALPTVVGQR